MRLIIRLKNYQYGIFASKAVEIEPDELVRTLKKKVEEVFKVTPQQQLLKIQSYGFTVE